MFLHTSHVEARPGFKLYLQFNNGICGEVCLMNELWGEVFEPLKDEKLFSTAQQNDEMGTVVWANGADFAPEFLFNLLQVQSAGAK